MTPRGRPRNPSAKPKLIRDEAFAKRLTQICDDSPVVPEYNYGRLTWIKDQFQKRFNEKVSVETVRKWFSGEVKPRPEKVSLLATLLQTQEAWLSLGKDGEMNLREQKVRAGEVNGVVLLVAGLVEIAGNHVSFPTETDKAAKESNIDFRAIFKGVLYPIHVSHVRKLDETGARFVIPSRHEDVIQIGVIPLSEFSFRLIKIPDEIIAERGSRRGATIDLVLANAELAEHEIHTLTKRL